MSHLRGGTSAVVAALLVTALAGAACSTSTGDTAGGSDPESTTTGDSGSTIGTGVGDEVTGTLPESEYLGSYTLTDEEFGTMTTVTVEDGVRTIETNALPDHETGEFPNPGNPNSIRAQDQTWEFPADPQWSGEASEVRVPGVAVNGVKFEPGTAETVSCDTGETYRVEAIQGVYDLGLDFNNAHVQPNGEYHYHGISQLLVGAYDHEEDLVHVGFAADGHLIYYSKSGALSSGYVLSEQARSGTDCAISLPGGEAFDLEGSEPDGTYSSDWVHDGSTGDLDECNGTTIDGEYAYFVTDTYPYVSRCLKGDVADETAASGPPGGGNAPR